MGLNVIRKGVRRRGGMASGGGIQKNKLLKPLLNQRACPPPPGVFSKQTIKGETLFFRGFYPVFSLAALLLLVACGSTEPIDLSRIHESKQRPEFFKVCHGYGCREKSRVRLREEEWQMMAAPLAGRAIDAEGERRQIAMAIAVTEEIVGAKTGTDADGAGASMFGYDYLQMDCIDEAVNTSMYLRFFAEKGLLEWHEISTPARRGAFIDGEWPHNTAVIRERGNGARYAVDSWYGSNGQEPHIVPLETWLVGWRPE